MLIDQKIDELSSGYYRLKRCEVKRLLKDVQVMCDNSTVQAMRDNSTGNVMRGISTVNAMRGNSTVQEMYGNSIARDFKRGISAYGDSTREGADRGLNPKQIMATGAVSGGIMGAGASAFSRFSGNNSVQTNPKNDLAQLDPLNALGLQDNVTTAVDTSGQLDYNNSVTSNDMDLGNRGDFDVINKGQANERSRNEVAGDLRDSTSGSSEYDITVESRRADGGTDTSVRGAFHVVGENSRSTLNKIGVTDNEFRETTSNPELFSFALESGKTSNANGVMVDSHTAEELQKEGAITFLAKDNMSGGAVMPDGNITAVFKNSKSKSRRAGVDIITTALENGGNKLDCYGKNLLSLYASLGFEPVARVKFNTEYAPEGWDFDKFGMPDIYVMKHNGQSTDLVVSNLESGNIKTYTEAEIESLPYMEYDEAMSYRDSLMPNNMQPQVNSANVVSGQEVIERIASMREDGNQRKRSYNDSAACWFSPSVQVMRQPSLWDTLFERCWKMYDVAYAHLPV